MKLERAYPFEDADAIARLRALTDYWQAKHGIASEWESESPERASVRLRGKKMGVRYDAKVIIGGGVVSAEVDAGFLARKLGAPAYVERKVELYLDPDNTIADLEARIPGR